MSGMLRRLLSTGAAPTRLAVSPRPWSLGLLLVATVLFLSGCAMVPVHAGGGVAALLTALALALAACGGGGGSNSSGDGDADEGELAPGNPTFSAADTTANEGDSTLVFTVTRAADTAGEVTVEYTTDSGSFFTQTGGTLTFGDGVAEGTVSVPLTITPDDELQVRIIELTLSNPSAGSITDATALGGVVDQGNLILASSWDGSFGTRLDGDDAEGRLGGAVGAAGDINGDGRADLVVAAPHRNYDGDYTMAGRVYVLTEPPSTATLTIDEVGSTVTGFVADIVDGNAQFGHSAAGVGDISGDGIGDLGIGSTNARGYDEAGGPANYTSQATFIYGSSSPGNVNLTLAGGQADRFVYHTHTTSGFQEDLNRIVAPLGDFDGDGRADFMVGDETHGSSGAVAIISGIKPAGDKANNTYQQGAGANWYGMLIRGNEGTYDVGAALAAPGDVDGDGFDDALVAAPNGGTHRVFLIFGAQGAFDADSQDAYACASEAYAYQIGAGVTVNCGDYNVAVPDGIVVEGTGSGSGFAYAIAAGDVNCDTYQDIIVGEPFYGDNAEGRVHVVFGDGTRSFNGLADDGTIDLGSESLTGSNGFTITGGSTYYNSTTFGDQAGSSVAALDMNGDGCDEIVIGAYYATVVDQHAAGKAFVLWGHAEIGNTGTFDLGSMTSIGDGVRIHGAESVIEGSIPDWFGYRVANAGDINGDGLEDLAVGSPGYDASPYNAYDDRGAVFVIFGASIPR